MRILLVGDPDQPHTQRWAAGLAASGADVAMAGLGEDPRVGVPFHRLGSTEIRDARYLMALPALRKAIAAESPDVIHAHFVSSYGVLSALAAGARPVLQFAWGSDVLWHDRRSAWHRRLVGKTLARAAAVVVDARDVGTVVTRLAPDVPIELIRFGPEEAWTTAARSERRSILSPRQLKPFYNVESVVRAFGTSGVATEGWTLDVLTGGAPANHLLAVAQDLGIDDHVTLWPRLSRDDLQQRFLEAAVFCSVPSSDATSVAVLEGMAAGVYPIVSDLAANRALVTDRETGLVVPPGDVSALAEAIGRAVRDPDGRAEAAESNRAWIREHATWEVALSEAMDASERARQAPSRRRRA